MKISVIMLTYNRENFVGRAIESILTQDFRDYEFIIVDNGSSDRSGAIADEYAQKDSRIHVIHRPRGNIGSGRNTGLDAATGDYFAFIDDDDWAESDFLSFLYRLATENNADVSICGATNKVFEEKRIMTSEESLVELLWRKKYNNAFPTKLFSRSVGSKIRFSESDKYDDISQMYKLLAYANCVVYDGSPKYTFYRHESNNSAWTANHKLLDAYTLEEYLRIYRERTKWLCGYFPLYSKTWQYFEWSFMLSMVEKINRLNIDGCSELLVSMHNELRKHRQAFLGNELILDFEKNWMEQYI